MIRACSLVLLACAACSPMAYTQGVPNLHEIEPGLWRGGQPEPDGWAYLARLGVKHVIKLNFEDEGTDGRAEALGMVVHRVPFPPSDVGDLLGGPSAAQLRTVVALMSDPTQRPMYVHCSHGHDRTGLVVGAYRVRRGWPKSRAWREMRTLGYHELLLGLTDAWHDLVPVTP